MKLVLVSFCAAIGVGYLLHGRLSNLSALKVRWFPLALVGLAMQLAPVPGRNWPIYLLYASFVLLLLFAFVNVRVTGFVLVAVGILLNFSVIAANGGMPVSKQSLVDSGQASTLSALVDSGGAKHHLVGPDDRITFLADVIAIPPPVAQSVSLGDIFTYAGVGVLIVAAMRRRPDHLRGLVTPSRQTVGGADERA